MDRRAPAAFLKELGLSLSIDELWIDPRQKLSALCYIISDGSILLLKRNRPPFTGHWTAPGGKLLPGESPLEGVIREVREETSLELTDPQLRFIASETGDKDEFCWLLFGFVAYEWHGKLGRTSEGELAWLSIAELPEATIPDVDRAMFSYVFEPPRGQVYVARIRFGPAGEVDFFHVEEAERTPRPSRHP